MNITHTIEIDCKPVDLFPWIAEPQKAMRWQKGVKSEEILEETPEKIGTTFREEMEENGNSILMVGEITDYIQDKRIAFHLESKIHQVDVSYSIAEHDNRSTLTVASTIRWKFPMNVISLFTGRKIKVGILQQTASEFAELKRRCEAQPEI